MSIEEPFGEDPLVGDPHDGRDAQPVEEGDQDAPETLRANDPLADRDPLDDAEDEPGNPLANPEQQTGTDPDTLPDGTHELKPGEDGYTGREQTEDNPNAEGPNDEEERFDAG